MLESARAEVFSQTSPCCVERRLLECPVQIDKNKPYTLTHHLAQLTTKYIGILYTFFTTKPTPKAPLGCLSRSLFLFIRGHGEDLVPLLVQRASGEP